MKFFTVLTLYTLLTCILSFPLFAQPGSLDDTFLNTGSGINGNVLALAIQPDRKNLAGGYFDKYNDITQNGIVRINTDGSIDTLY
jgi:hypothetical protein